MLSQSRYPTGYLLFAACRTLMQKNFLFVSYTETKNTATLVVGILCFFCLGTVFWVIDLITEITSNRITVVAD